MLSNKINEPSVIGKMRIDMIVVQSMSSSKFDNLSGLFFGDGKHAPFTEPRLTRFAA